MKKTKKTTKKAIKKVNSQNKTVDKKNTKKKQTLNSINEKLGKVLAVEKNILAEEKEVERKEESISEKESAISKKEAMLESLEQKTQNIESKEESDIEKLEELEKEIKEQISDHPLAKITFRDIIKGMVGAFIGLAVHYTFTYGVEISKHLDMFRASLLFIFTFIVGILFIYATGFRKIKDPKILMYIPLRLIVLYFSAIIMSCVVLLIFYPEFGHEFVTSYKMLGGVLLAAVVGACTADLIGKD